MPEIKSPILKQLPIRISKWQMSARIKRPLQKGQSSKRSIVRRPGQSEISFRLFSV